MNLNLLLVITTIIALLPIFFIKKYIITNDKKYIMISLFLYILLLISYIKIFRIGEISSIYVILQISQIIVIVIGGLIFFNEKITKNKIIGVIFSVIAINYLLKK